jgi:hypothetical protein
MKPLVNQIRRHLPPLKLYLEDLEQIVQLLNSISSNVRIRTNEHEFESVSELSQIKQKVLRNLQIYSSDSEISLRLTRNSATLYLEEDLPANRGVFEQISRCLTKRRTYGIPILTWSAVLVAASTFVVTIIESFQKSLHCLFLTAKRAARNTDWASSFQPGTS